MKLNTIIICIINLIVAGNIYAQPSITVLPYQSSGYRYKSIEPTATPPSGFHLPSFDDSSWSLGEGAFGYSVNYCPYTQTNVRTAWQLNTQLLVRKSISIPAGASNVKVKIMIDNDILGVFFNGVEIANSGSNNPECPLYDHHSITVPQNLIVPGTNYVAFRLLDRGGESFFDTRIIADSSQSSSFLDFDGDGKTDFSVVRESTWYNLLSSSNNSTYQSQNLGNPAFDYLTPGDYDGDGKTDVAVWRSLNGDWLRFNSSNNTFDRISFGQRGDEPVARDYDGDGKTDLAVVRKANGTMIWYLLQSTEGFRGVQFGLSIDYPVLGDFDGDGKFDIGVQRGALGEVGSNGQPAIIYLLQSSAGFKAIHWGLASDYFVSGDYDGDGKTDLAVVRDGNSYLSWYILKSSSNSFLAAQFGFGTNYDSNNNALNTKDLPTQGDYDGDGKTDIAVWRPSNGTFYVLRSSGQGYIYSHWGLDIDFPTATSNVY